MKYLSKRPDFKKPLLLLEISECTPVTILRFIKRYVLFCVATTLVLGFREFSVYLVIFHPKQLVIFVYYSRVL